MSAPVAGVGTMPEPPAGTGAADPTLGSHHPARWPASLNLHFVQVPPAGVLDQEDGKGS
jgi:hypothetical protein